MSAFLDGRELKLRCGGCGHELVLATGATALVANPDDKKWYDAAAKAGWRKSEHSAECGDCAVEPVPLARRHKVARGK